MMPDPLQSIIDGAETWRTDDPTPPPFWGDDPWLGGADPANDDPPPWHDEVPPGEEDARGGGDRSDVWRVEDADDLDDGPIPPREWLLGAVLCRGYFSVLVAAGGTGKSSLALAWALSLATGRPLTGDHVHHRCRVLLVTAEDGRDELRRRLRAARIHHGIAAIGAGWLNILVLTGSGVTLVRRGKHGQMVETDAGKRIAEAMKQSSSDVVILDPWVKLSGAPENENDAVDHVTRILVRIADECRGAVLALHHPRKGMAAPGDIDAARGAGALIASGRVGLTLTPMSADEAGRMGISEEERRRLIRLDDGKANLALRGAATRWYRLASVNLENGTPAYPNGDNVQAIERWEAPSTWDGLPSELLNRILDDIDAGMPDGERYSSAPRATDRAAWRVVKRHAPDKSDGQSREVIKAWLKTGLLLVEEYESPSRREPAQGLAVDHSKRPS